MSKTTKQKTTFSLIILLLISFLLINLGNAKTQIVQANIFGFFKDEDSQVTELDNQNISIQTDDSYWLLPGNFLEQEEPQQDITYPDFSEIEAAQYIVMDMESGEVLLEQGMNEIAYPASMTKILTALTVLESPDFDLEKPIVFSEYAVEMPSPVSVTAGFSPGEESTTKNALALMLIKSANDCAKALAENYGGTEADFVNLMNEKAEEIGCTNTNMTEAAGFGLEDHYFSPHDLALIIQRAMQNEVFKEIVSTKTYFAEPTSFRPSTGWEVINNSNLLLLQGDDLLNSPYLHTYDGVKTGTTDLAGHCLSATVHTYDGRHLCGIIFNGNLELGSGRTQVGVLLRGILEQAAINANCPADEAALEFLKDHTEVVAKIQEVKNEQINQIFGLNEKAEQEAQVTETTPPQTINEETYTETMLEERADQLEPSDQTESSEQTNLLQKIKDLPNTVIMGLLFLLFILLIFLFIKLLKPRKKKK
ncbi:MAG: D-alanyl-D-alanine carboxypeptidase [Clostridiaceae bacterium]|nr:D-alanyl-D-alanine carboxypeptidase [Clostridiaceae bacterium]